MAKETIETSLGKIWISEMDDDALRIWWPANARVGDAAAEALSGKARWDPQTKGYYASPTRREEVIEALSEI